jgi:iron complex outermembrane recepter protein
MKALRISRNHVQVAVVLALAGGSVGAGSALAQQAAGGLEEVVVTAQRRESNLQQTPIAVSAVDQNLIQQVSPQTIGDLAAYVPNFSATKITGFNAASFAMRGVGNTDIIVYNEAPVAVLVDDFVMPSIQTQALDAFDVQEIEVLRGPQGTLFGKNTTGGAVVVRTKQPVLNEGSAETRVQFGSPEASLRAAQAAVNLPLISDTLALRLVASKEVTPGYMHNSSSNSIFVLAQQQYNGTYTGDGARVGGTDVLTTRAKLLWQATDSLQARFQYEMIRDRSQTPAAVNETPTNALAGQAAPYFAFTRLGMAGHCTGDPLDCAGISNRNGFLIDMPKGHQVDTDGMYLNVDWSLAPGTLTWVNGYRSQDSSLPSDYTGIVGPFSPFDANRSDRRKTWQEELRFASKQIGAFNYVAGGFYQHDDTKFCVVQLLGFLDQFGYATPSPPFQPGGFNNNPEIACNAQQARSAAAYAEGNWKASDKLTVTLGARYTSEKKDFTARQQVLIQQLASPVGAIVPSFTYVQLGSVMAGADFAKYPFGVVTDSHSWSVPTYRLSVSYQFDPDAFGYLTFSHGFKAGGYNDQVGTGGTPILPDEKKPTNPEKADSFEVGIKSELFDRRLRLNEAAFYVKYKDAIRQVVTPITNAQGATSEETLFRNAAGLTVYGIENELTAKLSDYLTLRLPASYQHCKYDSFFSVGEAFDLTTIPVSRCPEWTATVALSYNTAVAGGRVAVEAGANYESKNLNTFSIANPNSWAQTYVDARTLVDASVTYYGQDDKWYLKALGRNLTDKRYRISGQNVDPLWVWVLYGEPRVFAAEVGVKFGGK